MAIKQIPINALSVGMYVVRVDRPWPELSDISAQHLIESQDDIERLRQVGVRYVIIDPTLSRDALEIVQPKSYQRLDPLSRDLAIARSVRAEATTIVQGVFEGVKTGAPINSVEVKKAVRSVMDTILRLHDPLAGLIHMQRNDLNMFMHATNVCTFALVVGKYQGYDKAQLERLGVGALLHDIGELRLPRNLYRKREPYTEQERRLIQQHPLLGVKILSQSGDVHEDSRCIVLQHHERLDGSGYPNQLRSSDISPLSEIVGIVDMYDAMISDREGRPPLPPSQAIKEIYQRALKGEIDRGWTERVIRCLGIYPVGSLVEMSTSERGIVVAANPLDALRPSVKLLWDATQQLYATTTIVDLAAQTAGEPERTILRALDPERESVCIESYLKEGT